jgi:peptidoglycan/LPS O-acetylase OafA/YrhL
MFNRAFIALRRYGFGSQRSVPSLDGLRAISIVFVLVSHLTGTRGFPNISALLGLGELGVRVFFVISGYLITSILLGELKRTGTVSLVRFYFRRTLRLFPASYFFIAVIAFLAAKGFAQLAPYDLTFALTYTMNYYDHRGWPLGHLWSLAVEEQFYLLWPATLMLLGRLRSGRFLLGALLATPFLRLASIYVTPAFNFVVWADALATGCLLAIFREQLSADKRYSRLLASKWFFLVPVGAIAANYIPSTKLTWLFGETIMNVAIAVSADWAMRNSTGIVGRFLNLPAVSFIGVLSYSLYVWQQPFLNRASASPYCAFPLNIILTFALAFFSYVAIEAPFLRLRGVVERMQSRKGQRADGLSTIHSAEAPQ